MSHYEVHDPRFDPPGMPPEEPFEEERRGRGCLFWGCLTVAIAFVLMVLAIVVGGYFATRYVLNNFTTDEPAAIEAVELPPERLAEIEARFDAFEQALQASDPENREPDAPPPNAEDLELILTAEELNGLIQQDDDLRGKAFVRIADGQIGGEVSLPADQLPGGKGRYFNASADFEVSLRDGVLIVRLAGGTMNGVSIPQQALDQLAQENLAEGIDQDPELSKLLEKFDSLEVVEDRVVLRARRPDEAQAEETAPGVTGEIESFEGIDEPAGVEYRPAQPSR